jgi:integrase/recombinase XerD
MNDPHRCRIGRYVYDDSGITPTAAPKAWLQCQRASSKGFAKRGMASPMDRMRRRKGLRHGFGVPAVSKGIALNMVQKWLGHSQLTTTAIYANAVGEEEQNIASRMWI